MDTSTNDVVDHALSRRLAIGSGMAVLAALAGPSAAGATATGAGTPALAPPALEKPQRMPDAKIIDLGPIAFAGAVIRLDKDPDGSGVRPYIHANTAHYNAGVTEVYINTSGELCVRVANEGRPVITCGVWMDETVGGSYGVTGGISGGGSISSIRLNRAGRRLNLNGADGRAIASTGSNLWCSWTYGPKPS